MRTTGITLLLFLAGCGPEVRIEDGVGDGGLFEPSHRSLGPFVPGSLVELSVLNRKDRPMKDWVVCSDDPDRFEILSTEPRDHGELLVTGISHGVGQTRLEVLNSNGEEVASSTVEIVLPRRVLLFPGWNDDEPVEGTPTVLAGSHTDWLVKYYRGDEQIYGSDALSAEGEGFRAWTAGVYNGYDILTLDANATGTLRVPLAVGGEVIEELRFRSVERISGLDIDRDSEAEAEEGDKLVIRANARHADGQLIWGVPYVWTVEGIEEFGQGNEYTYTYDPAVTTTVEVEAEGVASTIEVHGERGHASFGCATASPRRAQGGLVLLGLALLGLRHRRR